MEIIHVFICTHYLDKKVLNIMWNTTESFEYSSFFGILYILYFNKLLLGLMLSTLNLVSPKRSLGDKGLLKWWVFITVCDCSMVWNFGNSSWNRKQLSDCLHILHVCPKCHSEHTCVTKVASLLFCLFCKVYILMLSSKNINQMHIVRGWCRFGSCLQFQLMHFL